jgi:hypothetical protein
MLRIKTALHGIVTVVSSASIIVSSVSASYAQQIIVDPSAPGTSFLQGKINYGMGSFDNEQTLVMGTAWVGPNYRITSKGLWESSDGLRQFRPPTYKPQLGKFQANFEQRLPNQSKWGSNGHVDVVD